MSDQMITIPLDEYHELVGGARFLDLLEEAGVAEWEKYPALVKAFEAGPVEAEPRQDAAIDKPAAAA